MITPKDQMFRAVKCRSCQCDMIPVNNTRIKKIVDNDRLNDLLMPFITTPDDFVNDGFICYDCLIDTLIAIGESLTASISVLQEEIKKNAAVGVGDPIIYYPTEEPHVHYPHPTWTGTYGTFPTITTAATDPDSTSYYGPGVYISPFISDPDEDSTATIPKDEK